MENRAFIGTYTRTGSQGIYHIGFENGIIRLLGTIQAENPSYLAVEGSTLYAVQETRSGSVASYHIQGEGIYELTGKQATMGDGPCHLCLDERYLYVSNYSSGSLAEFALNGNGSVSHTPRLFKHRGSSVHPTRQTRPHVHYAEVTPDKSYLLVCDLGADEVCFYRCTDHGIGDHPAAVRLPPGSGPRHAVFGRGKFWYVICELQCTILVYEGYGRDARLVQTHSALRTPEDVSSCAALKMSADGKFLLASVRGVNTLVLVKILENGLLGEINIYDCHGDWPRDASFSPCGRYVVCACERSDHLSVFYLAGDVLNHVGNYALPSPACVCFLP